MAESYLEINKPVDPDPLAKMKTFETTDGGSNVVHSEAVVPVDAGTGAPLELFAAPHGLQNGEETAVSGVAVIVLAANAARVGALLQNLGLANIRIGAAGVTSGTGIQLRPGGTMALEPPFLPMGDIYAIRESSVDSIAYAAEVT